MKNRLPPAARAALCIYNLFFPLALLVMLPGLLRRMFRRGGYQRHFGQRFGRYEPALRQRFRAGHWTWVHSISVGETVLALKLVRRMRELDPALQVVLSVTTSTGFAVAEAQSDEWLQVIYNPLDALPFVRRALDVIVPRRLIFIEAIWPNLLAESKRRGTPVALIPRLSPRSERRFRKIRRLVRPVFHQIDLLAAPEESDRPRWEALGVEPRHIHVTGNIKFDCPPAAPLRLGEFRERLRKMGVTDDTPVLLGGSTFPGEERILAEVYRDLGREHPGIFLILVPRHVERTPQIAAELTSLGFSSALRTAENPSPADILIIDTTGELSDWYHLSTVVFIGKSLTATGGQNPVEAVAAGRPVIFGRHMENFQPLVAQWIESDAAIQVADVTELRQQLGLLLRDPARREELATRARLIARLHEGATSRAAELLIRLQAKRASVPDPV